MAGRQPIAALKMSYLLKRGPIPARAGPLRHTTEKPVMTPLRKKMIDDMVLRGLAASTQDAYLRAVADLATFYRKSPEQLSSQEVQRFLLHLYPERGMAPMSVHRVLFGLRFFYHQSLERERTSFRLLCARRPSRLPEILSREEVLRLFEVTDNLKHRILLKTTYAAGLRGCGRAS